MIASEMPEPEDGIDYYTGELRVYTIMIEVTVGGLKEQDSDAEIHSRAVEGLRNGTLDGDTTTACEEKVRDIELDFETDLPFNRVAWKKAKLLKLGLNENGDPPRPGEKERPACETTLADFQPRLPLTLWITARIDKWCERCRQAFTEAFL